MADGLKVTFNPPLHLQRQAWILDRLRHENVQSVLDIGCGDGALLQCLAQPSSTLPPTTSLPATSPFVAGPSTGYNLPDLHLHAIHGLDPHAPSLEFACLSAAPPSADKPPFTGHERWTRRDARWMPLEVSLWQGGFEAINPAFEGGHIDAFVASEVIEHLTPDLLPLFAPIVLGHYRPPLLLLTTPNFTYNQRFSPPGEVSPTGYPDPTGRTKRVFRHSDHKFEWTAEEWSKYCMDSASEFGYEVDIGGLGRAVEPDPWNRERDFGFASHVAVFRQRGANPSKRDVSDFARTGLASTQQHILLAKYIHQPHPLSPEELAFPSDIDEVREAAKVAMNYNRKDTLTFAELWQHGTISLKCKGDIGALVRAFDMKGLDHQVWSVEDEAQAWETKVTWKKFVLIPDSPESHETDSLDDDWRPADDMTVEVVVDESFPVGLAQSENGSNEEKDVSLPDSSPWWASERTHLGWHDTNAEASDAASWSS